MQTKVIYSTMVLTLLLVNVTGQGEERRLRHQRSSNRTEAELEYSRNVNLVHSNEWKCSDPKPRLVYLNEAIDEEPQMPPDTAWFVRATVMHRCEAAFGCCNHPKTCQPVESETVTITFKSVHIGTGDSSYHRIRFSNHTRCACLNT